MPESGSQRILLAKVGLDGHDAARRGGEIGIDQAGHVHLQHGPRRQLAVLHRIERALQIVEPGADLTLREAILIGRKQP